MKFYQSPYIWHVLNAEKPSSCFTYRYFYYNCVADTALSTQKHTKHINTQTSVELLSPAANSSSIKLSKALKPLYSTICI